MRCVTVVKLDKFSTIERDVGALASEEVLIEFAKLLRRPASERDRRALRWREVSRAAGARQRKRRRGLGSAAVGPGPETCLSRQDKTVTVTCTVGFSAVPSGDVKLDAQSPMPSEACVKGRARAATSQSHPTRRMPTPACSRTNKGVG